MSVTDRAEYVAGLRALADILDQHEEVPLPYQGQQMPMTIHFLHGGEEKERMAAAIRAIGGTWTKDARDDYFDATTQLHGVTVTVTAFRDAVCERVVTGTREVTRTEQITKVTGSRQVTETVEDVEWRCAPLLSEVSS